MGSDIRETVALERARAALAALGVVPLQATPNRRERQALGKALRSLILAEVPAFSESGNPDVLPELDRHGLEHVDAVRVLLGGGAVDAFDFVREHARRRAEQRFPLEAVLHAYRCGHKVLAPWVRGLALQAVAARDRERVIEAVADFAIEFTNAASAHCTSVYVAHARLLAEAEGDRRTQLLQMLLSGYDESDGRIARLLRSAGYLDQRLAFCVALVRSVDPLEMESPPRAQRIVDAVVDALGGSSIRHLIGVRENTVCAVFSDIRRQSGWTAPRPPLSTRLRTQLQQLGPAVLTGLSADHPSTAFIPRAFQEAGVALAFARVGERVVHFAQLPIRRLLLHHGGDAVRPALPTWLAGFAEADARSGGALLKTLRAMGDADLNVQQAARTLGVHANTVYARLQRIRALSGLDAQRFHDLGELLLAADCRNV